MKYRFLLLFLIMSALVFGAARSFAVSNDDKRATDDMFAAEKDFRHGAAATNPRTRENLRRQKANRLIKTDDDYISLLKTLNVVQRNDIRSENFSAYDAARQSAKLIGSDSAAIDYFGFDIAVSGDTAIVGAPYHSAGLTDRGAAYIFVRTGTTWTQQAKLTAGDAAAGDLFGYSVAISGDTVVVGAYLDNVGFTDQGSAYVFTRSGTVWSQQQQLTAADGAAEDYFGFSVALSGDTIVVGALENDINAVNDNMGSAYVFVRNGASWTQQARLLASGGAANDLFGNSTAIGGETVIIGALTDSVGTNNAQGSAYVFVRNGASWTQQAQLFAADGEANDTFGNSVAINGDSAVIGAFGDNTGTNPDQGAAYVFTRSGTVWSQQAKLNGDGGAANDTFGDDVAISRDTIVVGASGDDANFIDQGSAYVFTRSGTVWSQQQQLTAADGAAEDYFGFSVALSGSKILIGGFGDDTNAAADQGSAYAFAPISTAPAINSLNPNTWGAGGGASFELTINGSGFLSDSTARWNGQNRATTFVSSTQLKARILSSDTQTAGQFPVTVFNPSPNGETSNAINFTILNCAYTISPSSQNFAPAGGGGSFGVTTTNGCVLTATASDAWINVVSGSGSIGSGTISFSVAANSGQSRAGNITVGGQIFTVNQSSGCVFSISPASANISAAGGTGSLSVSSGNGCVWTAAANSSWITITAGSGGSGNGTIAFSAQPNTGIARTGTIIVGGQTFTVNQDAGCSYSISPSRIDVGAAGGTGSFNVNSGVGCPYNAISNAPWITITGGGGSGNGNVIFSVAPNTGVARTGTITAGGQIFTVRQSDGCAYSLSSNSANVSAAGGNESVNVLTATGCAYNTVSNASWITITGGGDSGNNTITFSVAANTGAARTGTITVAGQTFTVNQAAGCVYTFSSAGINLAADAAAGSFNVASGAGCAWTASTPDSWISIASGSSGTGVGTILFNVAANNGAARTGTITAGGQTFTVRQEALPVLSINNVALNEGNIGTTAFSFTVNLSPVSNRTVSANFATVNETAVAGEDYTTADGTLTFAPGETTKTIVVQVTGDSLVETNETFAVKLSGANNAAIAVGQGTGTILNDDAGGSVQFSLSNYTVNENVAAAIVTVSRTNGAASGVSVNYTVSNGTATNGQDFTSVSGTVSFAANEMTKTFAVPIIDDAVNEPNETVILTLSGIAGGGTLGTPSSAVLTIIDDDGAPVLSVNSLSLNEGNEGTTTFNFTVSLLGASSRIVTVKYDTADGSAISPSDYQPVSGSLSFSPGETSKTVTISVNGDVEVEPNETFTLNLSEAANAAIAGAQGTGTIQNDDVCAYSISPASFNTGASGGSDNFIAVMTQANCSYSAVTNNSFIKIDSGASGSGNGRITFSVAANPGAARTGTITVAGQTFTVYQAAVSITSGVVRFDFDGDKKADVSVFRPETGVWYQLNSKTGFSAVQFGNSTDKIAAADYDGDGKTDIAVWRENPLNPDRANFYILNSSDGSVRTEQFGRTGDSPLAVGDWDDDGKADIAVYRAGADGGQNSFFYRPSSRPAVDFVGAEWGVGEDKPVVADYDGDGKADAAIYRPSSGIWYIMQSSKGFSAIQFGISTDKPVAADYDGDGKADQAVYRPSSGTWYINQSSRGFAAARFGLPSDIPAPADYDGDGKTDIAVYRPESGVLYQQMSILGFGAVQFGTNGDKSVPNAFVP